MEKEKKQYEEPILVEHENLNEVTKGGPSEVPEQG